MRHLLRNPLLQTWAFWGSAAFTVGLILAATALVESTPAPEPPPPVQPAPVSVEISPVHRGPLTQWLFAEGRVQAVRKEYLFFERAGRAQQVGEGETELAEGIRVRGPQGGEPGELLAALDQRELRVELDAILSRQAVIRARVRGLQANVEHATREANRFAQLLKSGAATLSDSERAALAQETAEAELGVVLSEIAAVDAEANRLRFELSRTELRAPFGGLLARVNLKRGDHVGQWDGERGSADREQAAAFVLVDPDELEIELHVAPSQAAGILEGARAWIGLTGGDIAKALAGDQASAVQGRVWAISPSISASNRAALVRVRFPGGIGPIRDGSYCSVWIASHEIDKALAVPIPALIEQDGGWYVYEAKAGVARRVPVVTGLADMEFVQIVSELTGGESVVVAGHHRLSDGAQLTLIDSGIGQP